MRKTTVAAALTVGAFVVEERRGPQGFEAVAFEVTAVETDRRGVVHYRLASGEVRSLHGTVQVRVA